VKDLYIRKGDHCREVKLPEYIAHTLSILTAKGIKADEVRVTSCLSFLDAKRQHPRTPLSPWQMQDGTIMQPTVEAETFWNAVSEIWNESQLCWKEAQGLIKPKSEAEKEQIQEALQTIEHLQELEVDEHQTQGNKLLTKNFEEVAGGGLVLREGASLSLQEALEAVGVGIQQQASATKYGSSANLRLGDIINAVEDKHGDAYTQVIETSGKTFKYITQIKMTSRYFPPKKRAELDPQFVLTYSHYMGCCQKALTDDERASLIRFAVKRSSTKESVGPDPLKQLASSLAKIPEDQRKEALEAMDGQIESTKEALNLARHMVQLSGGETGARRRFLYIKYPEDYYAPPTPGWQKLSNDFSKELAMQADLIIRLTPTIQIMEGPDTFTDIPFQYVSPEVIEGDPKHPLDIEVYADYRIVEEIKEPQPGHQLITYDAVGTKNGKADIFQIEVAESIEHALELLQKKFQLTDGRDKLGRLYNLRTE